ncbi:MAG: response regulator transcription factor [Bacteroidota bacterium]
MPPKKKIKIIVADDQEIFRVGLISIMQSQLPKNFECIAAATNGIELVEKVKKLKPDLVITDIKMPGLTGIQACKMIKEISPDVNVIALSVFYNEEYILEMINAGASGYLVKTGSIQEFFEAIHTVSEGNAYYSSDISEQLFGIFENSNKRVFQSKNIRFSIQEIKVTKLICRQLTTKEIAQSLKIGIRTVEDYRHQVQQKIGARNVVGIALYALVKELVHASDLI